MTPGANGKRTLESEPKIEARRIWAILFPQLLAKGHSMGCVLTIKHTVCLGHKVFVRPMIDILLADITTL